MRSEGRGGPGVERTLRKRVVLCEPKLGFSLSPASARNMKLLQSLRVFDKHGRIPRRATGFVLPLAWLLTSSTALAQQVTTSGPEAAPFEGEFSVQRFDPAPGPRNYFTTRGLRTEGHMAWSAGLVINYANSPFVLAPCAGRSDCKNPSTLPGRGANVNIVEHLVTGDA